MLDPGSFSNFVRDVFDRFIGKKAGVNILRHSKISDFLDRPQITPREREDLAKQMGHSLQMQQQDLKLSDEQLEADDFGEVEFPQ